MAWRYSTDELAEILGAESSETATPFHGVSTDTRTIQSGQVFFALSGENFDGNRFVTQAFEKGAAAAVTTLPNTGGPCVVVPDPLRALQRFAAHHRERHAIPLLAVTGSCGKTTSKDLIAAVLSTKYEVVKTRGNLNNDIGCPLSLLQINSTTERAVIELGANHRGEIAGLCEFAKPTESAITMISEAHLEGFGTLAGVAAAKTEIVEALHDSGTFYVNADDARCVHAAQGFSGRKVRFGSGGDVALESGAFDDAGEMRLVVKPLRGELRLPLPGRAYIANVLLAVAVGLEHGVDEFEGPLREACSASRMTISRIGPLEVIDDTYNANPASVRAALATLADRPVSGARMAALGEMLELGDAAESLHAEVGEAAAEAGVTHLFARGPHARATVTAAARAGVPHAEAMEGHEAIAEAIHSIARPGDTLVVKGSRGMAMEKVIEALKKLYEGDQKPDSQNASESGVS